MVAESCTSFSSHDTLIFAQLALAFGLFKAMLVVVHQLAYGG